MTVLVLPSPILLPARPVSRVTDCWRADNFSLETVGGIIPVFSRAVTAAPKDSNGVARTVTRDCPAWEAVDWDGDLVRESPALLLGASDLIYWQFLDVPRALTLYVEFIENGTQAIASAAIVFIGSVSNTGARLWIDSTGSAYRLRHDNGTSEVTSDLPGSGGGITYFSRLGPWGMGMPDQVGTAGAPTVSVGDRVALRGVLYADGSVQLFQSVNGGAETAAAQSAANTLASAWDGTRLYLNSTGSSNPGSAIFRGRAIDRGLKTAAQMQAVLR